MSSNLFQGLYEVKGLGLQICSLKKKKKPNKQREILKTRSASTNTKHRRIRFKDENDSSL
jgi:hypothetical protein